MVVLSDIIVCRHRSVSLNNEKNCCENSGDKIAFCEQTARLRRGKFSDSNSAYLKVLVHVKIFQFQDMLNESERYRDAANGLMKIYALVEVDLQLSSTLYDNKMLIKANLQFWWKI